MVDVAVDDCDEVAELDTLVDALLVCDVVALMSGYGRQNIDHCKRVSRLFLRGMLVDHAHSGFKPASV